MHDQYLLFNTLLYVTSTRYEKRYTSYFHVQLLAAQIAPSSREHIIMVVYGEFDDLVELIRFHHTHKFKLNNHLISENMRFYSVCNLDSRVIRIGECPGNRT